MLLAACSTPARIESSSGFYNWARKRMRLAPGDSQHIRIDGINFYAGDWIAVPPTLNLRTLELLPFEVDITTFVVFKSTLPMNNIPELDAHVVPADLTWALPDLPADVTQSVPGFELTRPGSG
jgi:hypothetical protein